jgi:TetR/AcrR family transcriptional regulator, transcriptional repressor for nem operon
MQTIDTRTRLVLSAMKLFGEKGYGSTSIADVLQHAEVHSGSLYHFFPGKQDFLLAVLDHYFAGIQPMLLQPAWADVKDPIERIFALLERYRLALLATECTYGCPIGSLALELHEPDPPVRERLAENFRQWANEIRGCLIEAGARLAASIDRRELAHFVLTIMEGAVMQARTFREIEYFDGAMRQMRLYFAFLMKSTKTGTRALRTNNKRKGVKRI